MLIEKTFTGEDVFDASHKAEDWCKENNISVGMMCRDEPRGLMMGDYLIAKWKNLSQSDKLQMDGQMTGNFRYGPVHISVEVPEDFNEIL